MPTYNITLPDGRSYKIDSPTELDDYTAYELAVRQAEEETRLEDERESKQRFLPNVKAGAAQAIGSGIYGLSDLIGYEGGKQEGKDIVEGTQEYADIPSFEEVKQAYSEGLGKGLEETSDFVAGNSGQVLGGLAPYAATAFGGARVGAMVGAPFGPVGSTIGGIAGGVLAPAVTYFYGQNRMRQEEEAEKARQEGRPVPEFNEAETLAYSALQSGAERLGLGVLGKYFPIVNKIIGAKTPAGVGEAATTGLTKRAIKGAAVGVAAELPVELTQQVLERQAAGLPLDTPDAMKEYEETLAAVVGGVAPLGAGAGLTRRNAPRPTPEETDDPEATPNATPPGEPPQPTTPVPPGGEQLALPEIGAPQIVEDMEDDIPEPINRTRLQEQMDKLRADRQLELDFDTEDPRSVEAERIRKEQEQARIDAERERLREEARVAQEQFETQHPNIKLEKVAQELHQFDELYPKDKYPEKTRSLIRKDLNERKKRYTQEQKQYYQRQKEEFERGVEYLRTQAPVTGIVDAQVAKALGVSPRAVNILNRIMGQNLDTMAGRAAVAEALADYDARGGGKVSESPLAEKLMEIHQNDFELEPETEPEGPIDAIDADTIEDYYGELYKRAADRSDEAAMNIIDAAAREAMGGQRWGRAKSKITRRENSQLNKLMREGDKQPDMFPPVELAQRRAAEKAAPGDQIELGLMTQPVPKSKQAEATTEVEEEPETDAVQDEGTQLELGFEQKPKAKAKPKAKKTKKKAEEQVTETPPVEEQVEPQAEEQVEPATETQPATDQEADTEVVPKADTPEVQALQRANASNIREQDDGSIESEVERDGTVYRVRWSPKKKLEVTPKKTRKLNPYLHLARSAYEKLFPPEEVQPEQEGVGRGRKAKTAVTPDDAQTLAKRFVKSMRDAYEKAPEKEAETADLIPKLLDAAEEEASKLQGRNLNFAMRDALGQVLEEVNRAITKPRADREEANRQALIEQLEKDRDELTRIQAESFAKEPPAGESIDVDDKKTRRKLAKELAKQRKAAAKVEKAEAELDEADNLYVPETEEEVATDEMPKAVTAVKEAVDNELSSDEDVMKAARAAADDGLVSDGYVALLGEYLNNVDPGYEFDARKRAIKSIAKHIAKSSYLRGLPSEVRAMYRNISRVVGPDFRRGKKLPRRLSTVGELKHKANKIIHKLGKDFPVEIKQSTKDIKIGWHIPDDVQGVYYDGVTYLVADNIHPAEVESVLAHEVVGHAGMEKMLGKAAFTKLVEAVNELKTESPTLQRIVDNIRARYTNIDGEYNLNEVQEAREIIAHLAEGRPQYLTDNKAKKLWNRVKNAVTRWLAKMGFGDLAEADLDRLIMEAAEYAMGNDMLTGAPYDKPQFAAVDMMRRAWKLGYRGTDMDEAGEFIRDVHSGKRKVRSTSEAEIQAMPSDFTQTIDYDEPSFSREGTVTMEGGQGQEFDKFIERDTPKEIGKNFWRKMYESVRRGDLFDTFRVEMVDSASVFDDRIMKLYNNAVRDAEGVLNPAYNYSQATRAEGLTADVMRTGELKLHKDGIWVAGDTIPDSGATIRNITRKAGELGERIGHERAKKAINLALIALRDRSLGEYNRGLQKLMEEAVAAGNEKLAARYLEMQKQRYYDLNDPEHREEYEAGLKAYSDYPEIQQIQKMWREFNNKIIDARVIAGLIDKETARIQKRNVFYVPYSRIVTDPEGELSVGGPQQNQSGVSGIAAPRKMKGALKDVAEINDVLDNMVRLTIHNVSSIVRNHAARQMVEGLRKVSPKRGAEKAVTDIASPAEAHNPAAVVSYWEDGDRRYFELDDPLTAKAFRGTENVTNKLFTVMAALANVLRRGVTFSPEFIISQLEQDVFRSAFYGGTKNPFRTATRVIPEFMKIRKNLATGEGGDRALNSLGIAGMIDYSPELSREQIERAYQNKELTFFEKVMLWAERNAEASDLAPRKAVYEQTMAETGDRALAMYRANEIINFNRRGAGSTASILRQIIPFQNAYMQGMNVMAKTLAGRGLSALEKKMAIAEFVKVGLKLAALSSAYAMLMGDDDEYIDQADYIRSRYFLIPTGDGTPPIKFAAPADIALLFKAIPELFIRKSMYDNIDNEAIRRELRQAATNAFIGPDPVPQLVKPAVGLITNYDFLTGGDVIAPNEENLDTVKQFRDSTSELARALGNFGISPIKADYFIRGTFGSLGSTMLAITDELARGFLGINRPDRAVEQMPIARALFAPRFGVGTRSDYYQLRDDVRGAVKTLNRFVEDFGTGEEIEEYIEENLDRLQASDAVNNIDQIMLDINKAIRMITDDPSMTPVAKRREIDKLNKLKSELNKQIREVRKQVYG